MLTPMNVNETNLVGFLWFKEPEYVNQYFSIERYKNKFSFMWIGNYLEYEEITERLCGPQKRRDSIATLERYFIYFKQRYYEQEYAMERPYPWIIHRHESI
jgi:acyl carrier protein phosphodiesterase